MAIRAVAVESPCAFVLKASGRQRCCAPLAADGAPPIDARSKFLKIDHVFCVCAIALKRRMI